MAGTCAGRRGIFPANFAKEIQMPRSKEPQPEEPLGVEVEAQDDTWHVPYGRASAQLVRTASDRERSARESIEQRIQAEKAVEAATDAELARTLEGITRLEQARGPPPNGAAFDVEAPLPPSEPALPEGVPHVARGGQAWP